MSGGEKDLRELAAAYSLGALDPDEARAFEAFLATSPETQREVAEYREVGALLALEGGAAAPDTGLRARVLARATAGKVSALPAPARPWGLWAALAASLVAAVGLGLSRQQLAREVAERQAAIAALTDSLTARDTRLAEREATLNYLLEPNVSLTRLTATGDDQPVVQLFWNHRTNLTLMHVFNLKPAGDAHVYQLWFIPKGGAPIPSVTFNTEATGHGMVQQITVPAGVELAAAAVTLEPEGGSPQPTTTPFVVGTFPAAKS